MDNNEATASIEEEIAGNDPEEIEDTGGEPAEDAEADGQEEALPDFSEDKETIGALFPSAVGRETEFTENERYIQLRALGLSVKEAFLAVGGERRNSDNRSHLTSSVPRSAAAPYTQMSRREMEYARSIFEGMEESEIRRLYRKVTK